VAFITDEPGIWIAPLDVVRSDVVSKIFLRGDSPGEVSERHVWISADSPLLDQAKIPVISARHFIVIEGQWRRHRQQVADPGGVVDSEGRPLAVVRHFQGLASTYEGAPPWVARKEDADSPIRIDPHDGDVS
jgi:hypothetical protein